MLFKRTLTGPIHVDSGLGSFFSPVVQCGSTFVYLSHHSSTCLEWMRKLDLRTWSCVCM
uniref:Uncharacterized protein n=1 Tax=Anabas testudineus TaxID=64144 RepID=A0A7N6A756_ANATE